MNAKRRKRLEDALSLLEQAIDIINEIRDEEEDAYNNLPEGIKESERGEQMSVNVSTLEDAATSIEEAAGSINETLDA